MKKETNTNRGYTMRILRDYYMPTYGKEKRTRVLIFS